jgi:ribonuclease HII
LPRQTSCSWRFEDEARASGCLAIAGIDEVGRGALCGPVVVAAVILTAEFDTDGVDDSKRLTRKQRETVAARVRSGARGVSVAHAEPWEIDRINILRATHLAMKRALDALVPPPDLVLVDGHMPIGGVAVKQQTVVGGDALSYSIAAASVVAKVARDEMMRALDERCPGYGLSKNKGYGSRDHLAALAQLGPSEIHRRSFAGTQPWLF